MGFSRQKTGKTNSHYFPKPNFDTYSFETIMYLHFQVSYHFFSLRLLSFKHTWFYNCKTFWKDSMQFWKCSMFFNMEEIWGPNLNGVFCELSHSLSLIWALAHFSRFLKPRLMSFTSLLSTPIPIPAELECCFWITLELKLRTWWCDFFFLVAY